ncbi:hypothetical protein D9756_001291 [Leucocoprinus leucothites]|uniref:Uncharacterized protein n=1 Tax=Leucocoprinus leucothites TaxID=201217 RepID=A0A8H5LIF8_9AGAR|nr:hypothetical protein D9756_001291 [Leucoagaricus leucothites]
MSSPPDPGSPTDSTSTSGTPPPEEAVSGNTQPESQSRSGLGLFQLANQISATFSGGASKRRNPSGGSSSTAAPARDTKLRRRGEASRSTWDTRGEAPPPRKEKDELVDSNLVDFLRKEIGDPFYEVATSTPST